MKKNKTKLYYIMLALVIVNTLLYVFDIRIPFGNRYIEIMYGIVMTILLIYVLLVDKKEQ